MSEEPKSIWKRKWNGPRGLIGWFVILAFATFVVIYALQLLTANSDKHVFRLSLIVSLSVAAVAVLLFAMARWLFIRRNRRRTLFGFACLATLIALFYAEENWRGHNSWQKYKRALEAKGETVDLAKLAPPPVPDDQNFAMAPIIVESISAPLTNGSPGLKNWYGKKLAELGHTNLTNHLEMPIELSGRGLSFTDESGDWRNAQKTDLKAWQNYYRRLATATNFFAVPDHAQSPAEDVLFALSKYDSSIEAVRNASQRPYSRFPLGYSDENPAGILLPHLAQIKPCLTTLRLRAIAELQSGQSEKALEDVKLMFRLTDSIRTEPILISQLVRMAMLQMTIQPIWEGLAEHKWNDAQLSQIESELGKLDFLADYEFAMRGERALGVGGIDYLKLHRNDLAEITAQESPNSEDNILAFLAGVANKLVPDGLFEQNKLTICRMYTDYLLPMVNIESRLISLGEQKRGTQAIRDSLRKLTPYNWFARYLMPALEKAVQKFGYAQEVTDLARIACALERYHLAHGNYPETLDALTPQFLKTVPHDIIGGQPLKYRRTEDGQFVLYSIGWNEKDDGGTVALSKGKSHSVDIRNGDWVWKYREK